MSKNKIMELDIMIGATKILQFSLIVGHLVFSIYSYYVINGAINKLNVLLKFHRPVRPTRSIGGGSIGLSMGGGDTE